MKLSTYCRNSIRIRPRVGAITEHDPVLISVCIEGRMKDEVTCGRTLTHVE